MNYEKGLRNLKESLKKGDGDKDIYLTFSALESNLKENLRNKSIYGDSENLRHTRSAIIDSLNRLALDTVGQTFNDLCEATMHPATEKKRLKQILSEKDPVLSQRLLALIEKAKDTFLTYQDMAEISQSGLTHIKNVLHNLDDLLTPGTKEAFHPFHIFLLLTAVYLHDIGKITREFDWEDLYDLPKRHPEKGQKVINTYKNRFDLNIHEAWAVGCIVYGHGENDINRLEAEWKIGRYPPFNIRYLAALLRLADELDMDYSRFPEIVCELLKIKGKERIKLDIRQSISAVKIDNRSGDITVYVSPLYPALIRHIEEAEKHLKLKIDEIAPILSNLPYSSSKIQFKVSKPIRPDDETI